MASRFHFLVLSSMRMPKEDKTVKKKIKEEAECGKRNNGREFMTLPTKLKSFWEKVKESDCDDRSGAKTENDVELVTKTERKEPAKESRGKRAERYEKYHREKTLLIIFCHRIAEAVWFRMKRIRARRNKSP
jgi:hypothetical protein